MALKDAVAISALSFRSERNWFAFVWKGTAWAMLLGSIVYYVRRDALHYLFHYTPESFKAFWPDRILIRTHVACAITMIFTGPFQFWTGFRMRYLTLIHGLDAFFWYQEHLSHRRQCIWDCIRELVESSWALAFP